MTTKFSFNVLPIMKYFLFHLVNTGNLGNILIIIVPAVCKEKGSPFGAPDICSTYGLAYASLSMAVCFPTLLELRWDGVGVGEEFPNMSQREKLCVHHMNSEISLSLY